MIPGAHNSEGSNVLTSTPVVIALTTAAFVVTVLLAWLVLTLRRPRGVAEPDPGYETRKAAERGPAPAAAAPAPTPTPTPTPTTASLRSIRGIGPATEARLSEHGIRSVDDLANLDFEAFEELRSAIGRRPEQMSWIAEARRFTGHGVTEPEID